MLPFFIDLQVSMSAAFPKGHTAEQDQSRAKIIPEKFKASNGQTGVNYTSIWMALPLS